MGNQKLQFCKSLVPTTLSSNRSILHRPLKKKDLNMKDVYNKVWRILHVLGFFLNLPSFRHAVGLLALDTDSSPSWDQGGTVEEAKSNRK